MNMELNISNVDQSNSKDAHNLFPLAFEAQVVQKVMFFHYPWPKQSSEIQMKVLT
jgi:hypothetical protein